MIKINTKIRDLDSLCEKHYKSVESWVTKRLQRYIDYLENPKETTKLPKDIKECLEKKSSQSYIRILKKIKGRLVSIITEKPIEIKKISDCINLEEGIDECFKELLKNIFNYKYFSNKKGKEDWNTKRLIEALDIQVCLYCNRNYIFHVKRKNSQIITTHQFDHFYPKSEHPLLALSFYNLIPSCPTCNRLKSDSNKPLLHPYLSGFDCHNVYFTYKPKSLTALKGHSNEIEIDFTPTENKEINNSIKIFGLKAIYQKHAWLVQQLIQKYYVYTPTYITNLNHSFKQEGFYFNDNETYNMLFNSDLSINNYEKHPLAKLITDITRELGIGINNATKLTD